MKDERMYNLELCMRGLAQEGQRLANKATLCHHRKGSFFASCKTVCHGTCTNKFQLHAVKSQHPGQQWCASLTLVDSCAN